MDIWLEHLVEPRRLILSWRPPSTMPDRSHWAVGELTPARFRYYAGHEFAAMNLGRVPALLREAGFLGYPAFRWVPDEPAVFDDGAVDAFLRRVPSPRRSDFGAYLAGFGVRSGAGIGGLTLLGLSMAALPGDGFSLVDPLDPQTPRQDVIMDVAGFRHHAASAPGLQAGQALDLRREPDNPKDSEAVQVCAGGVPIGHVGRLQCRTVARWLATREVSAILAKVNGSPGDPRARLLLRVREGALAPAG